MGYRHRAASPDAVGVGAKMYHCKVAAEGQHVSSGVDVSGASEICVPHGCDGSTGGSTGEGKPASPRGDTGNALKSMPRAPGKKIPQRFSHVSSNPPVQSAKDVYPVKRVVSSASTSTAQHTPAQAPSGAEQALLARLLSNRKACDRLRAVGLSPAWLAEMINKKRQANRANGHGPPGDPREIFQGPHTFDAGAEGDTYSWGQERSSGSKAKGKGKSAHPVSLLARAIGKDRRGWASIGPALGEYGGVDVWGEGQEGTVAGEAGKGKGGGKAKGKGGKDGKGKGATPPAPPPPPSKGASKGASGTAAGRAKSEPRKPDVKPGPGVTLKKLFWNSFRLESAEDTIWALLEDDNIDIDYAVLEELFALVGTGEGIAEEAPKAPRVKRVQVLGSQRRKQLCVMLARLPSIAETCQAIFNLDAHVLDREQVELLLLNMPPEDEIRTMKTAESDHIIDEFNVWDTAEDFVLSLSQIPDFQLRLELWDFNNAFVEHTIKIHKAQRAISAGCDSILKSQAFRHLLGLVLATGNYLNGGTSRGRADGFSIDALVQVSTVKMSQASGGAASGSLVDYLVQQMEAKYSGELSTFFAERGEAVGISNAAEKNLEELEEEMKKLHGKATGMLKSIGQKELDNDGVFAWHREILCMCLADLEEIHRQQSRLKTKYGEVCSWFRMEESSAKKSCINFFGIVDTFAKDIFKARQNLQEQERKAEKRRERSQSQSLTRRTSLGCALSPSGQQGNSHSRSNSLGPAARKGIHRRMSAPALWMTGAPTMTAPLARTTRVEKYAVALESGSPDATKGYIADLLAACLHRSGSIPLCIDAITSWQSERCHEVLNT
jgi:hypothetical protein